MFLKVMDYNPSSSRIPSFYECDRILPQTGDGVWGLRLEGPGDQGLSIEFQPGCTYRVLNSNGGNVDTIQVPTRPGQGTEP